MLRCCREEVDAVASGTREVGPVTILCLMLLVGRRTCEIVNGRSLFESEGDYTISFTGQAKRRRQKKQITYSVPCLHSSTTIVKAFERINEWVHPPSQKKGVSENQMVSQKYQSLLRRTMLTHPVLHQAGRVHALRGLYARMTYRLFDWKDDYSEAFVVMHVLGHLGLNESLVYTSFHIGDDFDGEDGLGPFDLETSSDEC